MPLSLCNSIFPMAEHMLSQSNSAALVGLSHAIEDVAGQIPGAPLIIGFQRFSNFLPQERRYRRLASDGRPIWVCGLPDATPPPIAGVTFVPLQASWPLAREWFVAVNTPGFFTALLAAEQDSEGAERRFTTLLISDPAISDLIELRLSVLLRGTLPAPSTRDYVQQQRHLAMLTRRVVDYQQRQAAWTARQQQHLTTLRSSLVEQVRELQALSGLVPQFGMHEDWQSLLLVHIQRVADRLTERIL